MRAQRLRLGSYAPGPRPRAQHRSAATRGADPLAIPLLPGSPAAGQL